MLPDLQTSATAVLSDLLRMANTKDVIKNLGPQPDAVRNALAELTEYGIVEELHNDGDTKSLQLHVDPEDRAGLLRRRPVPLDVSELDSSQHTDERDDGSYASGVASPATYGCVKPSRKSSSGRLAAALQSQPVETWQGTHLTTYLLREVQEAAVMKQVALGPAPFNFKALSGAINRWLRNDGIEAEVVKAMIDLFVMDVERHVMKRVPVWKMFLARRQYLLVEADRVTREQQRKTGDESYWTERSERSYNTDPNYWTGVNA